MWPGKTADVTVLVPVIDQLRKRFSIGQICIVTDRRTISAETIAALEARRLLYILGARERTGEMVREWWSKIPPPSCRSPSRSAGWRHSRTARVGPPPRI